LFFSVGWHWRWRSFGDLDGWVGRWAAALGGHPAGTRLRFPYRPSPQGVALDLAAQAAGLIAQPVAAPAAPEAPETPETTGAPWRVEVVGPEGGEGREVRLPAEEEGAEKGPAGRGGAGAEGRTVAVEEMAAVAEKGPEASGSRGQAAAVRPAGGVVVEMVGDEEGERFVSQAELAEWVRRIGAEVEQAKGAAGGARPRREVVVSRGMLGAAGERALLAWATVAGAAVVLEPAAASLVATAAWARPTVFAGTVAEIGALRRVVEGRRRWWPSQRLPFGRLRLLLVRGGEALAEGEADLWRERGVRVASGEII
jgi:hypothetical protein